MSDETILIAEHENIVAMDMGNRVEKLGYRVCGMADTGEKAIRLSDERSPHLVLMDIKLKGNVDGIEAAGAIRNRFNIPVIYVTAFADHETLRRANITEPFGYIMKPIEDKELRTTIEISLYKHQVETRLMESEERYRTVLGSIEEGYFEVDLTGSFIFVNDWFCRILDDSPDAILKMSYRDYTEPEESERIFRIFNKIYRTGTPVSNLTIEVVTKKRTKRYHEFSASLTRDRSGRPIGFRGVARDITERREIEEERERLQARLQRTEKMEALGTLAGGVAHELNNVLTGIVGYPELLLLKLPEDSPLRKPLLTMKESGIRAAAIINELLTLGRRNIAATEVINLNHIVSQYLRSPEYSKLKSSHPDVQIKLRLDERLLNVLGTPVHLSKSLANLILNAAESMPDGGRIRVSTENRYMDTSTGDYARVVEGDYATLIVSDNGVGMSPDDKERIFEPFYTKKIMGRTGTGLGMAVVWGTVQDHNGYVDINSRPGKGTTFTVYFPATREELPKDRPRFSVERYQGNGESVLVVDDLKDQREIAYSLLSHLGYSVTTLSSGEDAVEYVRSTPVDLVILDMIMHPGMDGLATYERILSIHPGQKAIIASGFSETHHVKKAQKLGACQYISKPYTLETIASAVRNHLSPA